MIIWSGLGFLVAVVTFGMCLLANFFLDAHFGEGYYSSHPWAVGLALTAGGLISSGIGFLLKRRSERFVFDDRFGIGERIVIYHSGHNFFFIPMHWAGIVVAVIGVGIALSNALN